MLVFNNVLLPIWIAKGFMDYPVQIIDSVESFQMQQASLLNPVYLLVKEVISRDLTHNKYRWK